MWFKSWGGLRSLLMVAGGSFIAWWGTLNYRDKGKEGWPKIVIAFEAWHGLDVLLLGDTSNYCLENLTTSHKSDVLFLSQIACERAFLFFFKGKLVLHPLMLVFVSVMRRGLGKMTEVISLGNEWNNLWFMSGVKWDWTWGAHLRTPGIFAKRLHAFLS